MAIQMSENFKLLSKEALDGRISYKSLSEMVSMQDSYLYDGCLATIEGDTTKKIYQWWSSNAIDSTLGKWRELEFNGEVPVFTQAEWNALSPEEKLGYAGKQVIISDDISNEDIINDEIISNKSTWSSNKINESLGYKQTALTPGANIKIEKDQDGNTVIDLAEPAGVTVHEKTTAEYEALSEAEKNNGDFYHITDAEPSTSSWVTTQATITDETYTVIYNQVSVNKDLIAIKIVLRNGNWNKYEWKTIANIGFSIIKDYPIMWIGHVEGTATDSSTPGYGVVKQNGDIQIVNTNPPVNFQEINILCMIPRL